MVFAGDNVADVDATGVGQGGGTQGHCVAGIAHGQHTVEKEVFNY